MFLLIGDSVFKIREVTFDMGALFFINRHDWLSCHES